MQNDFIEACKTGNLAKIAKLLESPHVNVNSRNEHALRIACFNRDEKLVQLLLDNGASILNIRNAPWKDDEKKQILTFISKNIKNQTTRRDAERYLLELI